MDTRSKTEITDEEAAAHVEKLKAMMDPAALRRNGKFVAKLTDHERHAAFGLMKMGYPPAAVAHAFGITRQTASYMIRTESPHYKNLRHHWWEYGEKQFLRKWVTEEDITKVEKARKEVEARQNDEDYRLSRQFETEDIGVGHKRADHKAGRHLLWSETFKNSTAIEVRWVEANEHPDYPHEAGWAVFIDWKGSLSMYADTVNDKALVFTTSKAAYDQYKADMDLTEAVEE